MLLSVSQVIVSASILKQSDINVLSLTFTTALPSTFSLIPMFLLSEYDRCNK